MFPFQKTLTLLVSATAARLVASTSEDGCYRMVLANDGAEPLRFAISGDTDVPTVVCGNDIAEPSFDGRRASFAAGATTFCMLEFCGCPPVALRLSEFGTGSRSITLAGDAPLERAWSPHDTLTAFNGVEGFSITLQLEPQDTYFIVHFAQTPPSGAGRALTCPPPIGSAYARYQEDVNFDVRSGAICYSEGVRIRGSATVATNAPVYCLGTPGESLGSAFSGEERAVILDGHSYGAVGGDDRLFLYERRPGRGYEYTVGARNPFDL